MLHSSITTLAYKTNYNEQKKCRVHEIGGQVTIHPDTGLNQALGCTYPHNTIIRVHSPTHALS